MWCHLSFPWQHAGARHSTVTSPGIKKNKKYFSFTWQHVVARYPSITSKIRRNIIPHFHGNMLLQSTQEQIFRNKKKCYYPLPAVIIHVWLRIQGSHVQFSACPHIFCGDRPWNNFCGHFAPSADSRRAVISYWWKYEHKLWEQLRQLSMPRKKKVCGLIDWLNVILTLALLNPDIFCICKQCRSRRSQLIWICTASHLVYEFM